MKKIFLIMITVLSFGATQINAQNGALFFDEADSFFKTYTSNGAVDYKAIKSNPEALDSLLEIAASLSIPEGSKNEFQAFWINSYNLSVIKGIVDNYPINSPLDKKGFFDKTTYTLAGKKITLNDIENKMLRAKFNDARFHFVLVCGAKGCPPIIAEAYKPSSLDAQLERQTKKALNRDSFIKVSKNKVAFSEIFKWYKEDFVKNGTEIDFLNKYRKEKVSEDSKVTYYTYNWQLNSK